MTEFKLSYTANEINRKLGKVDNLVSTVNGVTPDENGNVNIAVGSTGGIADVVELPTENIKENCFYRLLTAKFVSSFYYAVDGWTCYCVNELPDIGKPVSTDMINITAYYNISDNEVYGYADETISTVGGIPVGWYPIGVLGQAFNVTWGGVITDVDNVDDSAKLLLSYDFYIYKNGWSLVPFAYEKQPKFDIQWDGVIGDRFALDISVLGFANTYFVKVSDEVFTIEQLVGAKFTQSDGEEYVLTSNNIDTTTYPGGLDVGSGVIVVYSQEDLNATLGLPSGYITNGTYFVYIVDGQYTNRLVAPTKIIKIDEKFLPDVSIDISSLGLHSVATTGNYNSLNNRPNLSNYATTSDVETMITEAVGAAIGGSY